MIFVASMPSIFGIMWSMNTMSYFSPALIFSTASNPLMAASMVSP